MIIRTSTTIKTPTQNSPSTYAYLHPCTLTLNHLLLPRAETGSSLLLPLFTIKTRTRTLTLTLGGSPPTLRFPDLPSPLHTRASRIPVPSMPGFTARWSSLAGRRACRIRTWLILFPSRSRNFRWRNRTFQWKFQGRRDAPGIPAAGGKSRFCQRWVYFWSWLNPLLFYAVWMLRKKWAK